MLNMQIISMLTLISYWLTYILLQVVTCYNVPPPLQMLHGFHQPRPWRWGVWEGWLLRWTHVLPLSTRDLQPLQWVYVHWCLCSLPPRSDLMTRFRFLEIPCHSFNQLLIYLFTYMILVDLLFLYVVLCICRLILIFIISKQLVT